MLRNAQGVVQTEISAQNRPWLKSRAFPSKCACHKYFCGRTEVFSIATAASRDVFHPLLTTPVAVHGPPPRDQWRVGVGVSYAVVSSTY